MARLQSRKPGLDPKIYRHFAIVTIAITAVFAILSSEGSQQVLAEQQQHTALKNAEEAKFGKTRLVDNRDESTKQRSAEVSFAPDSELPMDMAVGGYNSGGGMTFAMGTEKMPIIIEPNQFEMAKMVPKKREEYLKNLKDAARKLAAKGPYIPTQEQVAALSAASAARAGPPTTE